MTETGLLETPDELIPIGKQAPERKPVNCHQRTTNGNGNLDRCLRYLDKLPESISGQGGHNALFAAAAKTVEFDLTDSDAWTAICHFNETKCTPPWTERELRHKLADVEQTATRGAMLADDGDWKPEHRMRTVSDAGDEPVFVFTPSDILNAPEPPPPVFCNGPVEGILALIVAESGRSKSFKALELGVTVSTGRTILPTFAARKTGTVLVFAYEDPASVIKFRLDRISQLQPGLDQDIRSAIESGRLRFYCDPPPLFRAMGKTISVTNAFKALDTLLATLRPLAVILDPFSGFAELNDENSNAEIGAVARQLGALAAKHGCVILVVHHSGKGRAEESSQHMSRGGSSLACRSRWIVTLTTPKNAPDEDAIEARVVKDSYHRKANPVILSRGPGGELREVERPTTSPTEIAQVIADWLAKNPQAAVSEGALKQGKGLDAKTLRTELATRFPWCPTAEIAEAVTKGLRAGILCLAEVFRPNRTKTTTLKPGKRSTEGVDDDPF